MTQPTGPRDPAAERKAELQRRLASLTPEQRARLAGTPVAENKPSLTIGARIPGAPIPLSFSQEMLWGLERASPGYAYNVPRAVRLSGEIDEAALQRALNELVARHETLRTTFALVNDEPQQLIHDPAPVSLEKFDVSHLAEGLREEAAKDRMRELARVPFDLERDSQLRAALIRLDAQDHVLQMLSHHVATDGWSGNIVMRELGAMYEGFRSGTPIELPPLPVQFADYAAWQRRTLSGQRLEELIGYWRNQLANAPTQLELPGSRQRSATPGFDGAVRSIVLPAELSAKLQAFARSEGATGFMVFLSVLYVLLLRYTREEELIIGTPVAGRPYPELEGVLGFFTNTLLLRTSLGGNPTFRELLGRVRATTLGAYDNQEVPLESLLLTKGANDRPIAAMPQVVLSTEDPDRENPRIGGVNSTRVAAARGAAKFDLHLWVADRTDGIRLAAEYRTDLFEESSIDRMMQHFGVLLDAAISAPDVPVRELQLLTETERQQIFHEWNDTQAEYPEHATIHGLIEEQVRLRPDAIAIEYTSGAVRTVLTYADLDQRANRVAHWLVQNGAKRDDRIALCLERTADTAVAILGVLKAGAAYLPIDPAYPDDRIEFTVQDAGARLVLAEDSTKARLAGLALDAKVVNLSALLEPKAGQDDRVAPQVNVSPDDMAYVIYTSGSTGRPKGVMVEHRNVTRLLVNNRSLFDFNEHDVWTVFHSFAFDFSVWELYGALVFGGRAVIVPRLVAQSPADFLALLESSGTTVLNQVPSAFYGLMDVAVAQKPNLRVRYIIFGGEALKPALLRPWRNAWPKTRLINMFGITETTVHVTYKEIGDEEISAGVSNIGRPIPTLTMYVLDDLLQPVPVGVTGEICVGGLGVARGYLNRPELSAERFVNDPFGRAARLYRSGDLGRLMPTGEVEYLGRRDHQVKLRGHRIELGEIESALVQHAEVSEAVAMVREDSPGDQRLVAYIVASAFPPPEIGALRDWLRQSLPEVMVPAAFMFMDRMPLTGNGKVDRKALPVPQGSFQKRAHQSPRSTIEHELVQIWTRLLSPGRPISVFDDFFEIGGHSLLAIRMLAEVERVRGQRIPLAWLFESSTVDKLAARLGSTLAAPEQEPPLVALQEKGEDLPVAFVHGDWTGGGWYVRRLAPLVAPNAPFFVLPTLGVEAGEKPWTIESMAARHVSELRKRKPHGPYRVIGFCVGGMVAYEMARQLVAAGEVVDRLVVIDSTPTNARLRNVAPILLSLVPGTNPRKRLVRRAALMRRLRWLDSRIAYFRHLSLEGQSSWIVNKIKRSLPGRATAAAGNGSPGNVQVQAGVQNGGAAVDDGDRDALLLEAQATASSAYVPGRFEGTIEFCWAQGAPGSERRANPIARWRILARDVVLTPIESGHIGLITNNLPLLADALRAALNRPRALP